jgi:hypothetical protein
VIHLAKLSSVQFPVPDQSVFLLFDSFQLRAISRPFSDISLDIVEWAEDAVIFHTDPNPLFRQSGFSGEMVKFALLKAPIWRDSLRKIGEIVVWLPRQNEDTTWDLLQNLPLSAKSVKQLYLSADGQVKLM